MKLGWILSMLIPKYPQIIDLKTKTSLKDTVPILSLSAGAQNQMQAGSQEEVQGCARVRAAQGVQGLPQDGMP